MPTPIPPYLSARPTFARQSTDNSVLPLVDRSSSRAGTPAAVDVMEPAYRAPARRWTDRVVPALPQAAEAVQPYVRPVAYGLAGAAVFAWLVTLSVQVSKLWHVPMCDEL